MHLAVAFSILLPVALVGAMLPFLGRVRAGVLFGVTVPLDFANSAAAEEFLRRYRTRATALAILVTLGLAACVLSHSQGWMLAGTLTAVPLELAGAVLLWLHEHNKLKPYAAKIPLERTAELRTNRTSTPLIATIASLLPLVGAALWLQAHWNQIPARWPRHWNAEGVANGWGARSAGGVYGPLLTGAVLLLIFVGIAFFLVRAPGTQTRQRSRTLPPLAALAWLMSATFCLIGLLPLFPGITATTIVFFVIAQLIATFAVVIWMLWRSAMMPGAMATEPYDGTPDASWRAGGLVYFNPSDAAVLVPKRFGWGWTLNFARPVAWVYLGGVLFLSAAAVIVPLLLK